MSPTTWIAYFDTNSLEMAWLKSEDQIVFKVSNLKSVDFTDNDFQKFKCLNPMRISEVELEDHDFKSLFTLL